ncbi:MAG: Tn3 family transposase [Peptostreptococcaceae bacterium]|nr:Tn3 family transposase [Peptostreptococcaceae bacterium]
MNRAIFHENAGKFRVDTEKEQHIWNECSRLVGNANIFYNTFLLSKLLEQIDITKKLEIIERIKRVSPIAWQHVNLGGRFNLTGQKEPLEIELIINQLNDFLS